MAEKLRTTVTLRKMPPAEATAVFQGFGFAKSTDVTEDKFNEVLQALCDWQPPRTCQCLDCPAQYGGTCPEAEPPSVSDELAALNAKHAQEAEPRAPPDPMVSEKASLAEGEPPAP